MRRQGYPVGARLGGGHARGPLGLVLLIAGLALGCGQAEPQTSPQPGGIGRPARVSCDLYASPHGSDSSPGSRARPFRTAGKLVHRIRSGQTGCFRGGTYTFAEIDITKPNLTLAPYSGEAVTLQGTIQVPPAGAGSTIEGMRLDGAGGTSDIGPRIYADGLVLRNNEITNGHTDICVSISAYFSNPPPRGVVVDRNRIHDCGALPPTNMDHGIYVAHAIGTVIRGNWIYDNADRGIQLYPDAQSTTVTGNVIDSNGEGIVFSGVGPEVSNNNLVKGNVITNSRSGWNVYSGGGPTAEGNVVRQNCVWAGNGSAPFTGHGGVETPSRNFTASANVVVDPLYTDQPTRNYQLSPKSHCPLAGEIDRPGLGGRS
jgi:hypothetical protein